MIRRAVGADLEKLPSLDADSRLPNWSPGQLATCLEPPGLVLVWEEGNRLIGSAVFQLVPPEAELLRIAKRERWRLSPANR